MQRASAEKRVSIKKIEKAEKTLVLTALPPLKARSEAVPLLALPDAGTMDEKTAPAAPAEVFVINFRLLRLLRFIAKGIYVEVIYTIF